MGFSVSDLVTSDTGDYVTTDAGDRIFVRYTNDPFTPSLSFIGSLVARLPLAHQVFAAVLSFTGTFTRARKKVFTAVLSFIGTQRIFTPFIRMASSLSFIGSVKKKSSRSFTGVLSFIGSFNAIPLVLKLLTAALSFAGSFRAKARKMFVGAVSWIGDIQAKVNNTVFKTLTATVSFVGDLVQAVPIQMFLDDAYLFFISELDTRWNRMFLMLTSRIKFVGKVLSPWREVVSYIRVRVDKLSTLVYGFFLKEIQSTNVIQADQSVTTAASTIDLGSLAIQEKEFVFVKNMDNGIAIQIDSSSSFNNFPQRILPGTGVYITPSTLNPIYVRSESGTVTIQVLSARDMAT